MAWLNNTAATCTITIDGVDYSQELVSVQITDSSAINVGAVFSTAQLTLKELPGQSRLEDYSNKKFARGKTILIDITLAGVTRRHPRGHLQTIKSTYNMEDRSLSLEAGCKLTMRNLTDDCSGLESLTIFPLPGEGENDENDPTFTDLVQAVATEGKFLWQDNSGDILKSTFFGGDGFGSNKEGAAWVSVRDYTALAVAPLSAGSAVPDLIKVSYNWNEANQTETGEDPVTGKPTEEDTTESTYWLEHPANIKTIQRVCTTYVDGVRSCKEVAINSARKTFSVQKTSSSIRRYGGPGGAVSSESEITQGPAVEMAGGYYAELYAYRTARNNGKSAQLEGLQTIIQTKRERTYTYGSGGEVLQTVEKQYKNMLAAMTQNDWRAGNARTGEVFDPESPPRSSTRGFLTSPPSTTLYLDSITTVTYQYFDDRTVELTENLRSSAQCNGVGIYPASGPRIVQNIDADNNGVATTTKRTSMGGLLNPVQPPRNPGGVTYTSKSAVFEDESRKYYGTSEGNVTLQTTIPYSLPGKSENELRSLAANYAKVLRNQLEGDAAGIRVAETMRPEIFDYYPGMPFTFYDRIEEKVVKLRMNATGWAIAPGQAVFSTEGCFIGISNGTVNIPSNVDAPTFNAAFAQVSQKRQQVEKKEEELDQATASLEAKTLLLQEIEAEQQNRTEVDDPDQVFDVLVVQVPEFIVTTGAPQPDEVFDVTVAEP